MKRSDNAVHLEKWNILAGKDKDGSQVRKEVAKVAVRDSKGRFHGATNFRGSVIG